jgi:perosamine synthetase
MVAEVLRSGWLSEGPMTRKFEQSVAGFVGAKHGVSATSCTTAMEIALRALGTGHGDRVLVPDFTHPATADAVIAVGATPVLVDVDLSTYNMDLDDARTAAARGVKAAIPVSWGGYPLDKSQLTELRDDFDMLILEDAACSLGSECRGIKTGTMADITCFSFHPRKVVTTGEGGMATTDDDELAERMRSLKNFGIGKVGGEARFVRYGTNYKMSDILAAVGVAQMNKLSEIIRRRIKLADQYTTLLSEVEGIRTPTKAHDVKHIFQTYAVYVEAEGARDKLLQSLRKIGVEAQIGTYALHLEPFYRDLEKHGDLERSSLLYKNLMALPMSHNMTIQDQEYVVSEVKKLLRTIEG